jgi:hypothetical protein
MLGFRYRPSQPPPTLHPHAPPNTLTPPTLLPQLLQQDIRLHLGSTSRRVFAALCRLLDRSRLQVGTRTTLTQLAR